MCERIAANDPEMQVCELRFRDMTAADAAEIGHALKQNHNLKVLDIRHNAIGEQDLSLTWPECGRLGG